MCKFSSKSGGVPFQPLGDLTWNDPIMINDLVNSSNKFKFLMYADDTTLYFNLEDFPIENRGVLINDELEKVNKWLKLNKLAVNVDKTKSM